MTTTITKITNNIYIGNIKSIEKSVLDYNKIDLVISLLDNKYKLIGKIYYNHLFFEQYDDIVDMFGDNSKLDILKNCRSIYPILCENIESNKRVLIHCLSGQSRSVAVVIYFLMRQCEIDYYDAYEFVKTKRKEICVNKYFEYQLLEEYDKNNQIVNKKVC